MNIARSLLPLLLASMTFSVVHAQGNAAQPPLRAEAQVEQSLRDRVQRGESIEVLVVLDDADVERALPTGRAALGGNARLAFMRERRDLIKQRLLARMPPGEVEVLHRFDQLPMKFLRVRSAAALEALASDSAVLEVLPNGQRIAHDAQALGLIGQPQVAAIGQQGANTAVVVLDSGIDYTRPEFGSCTSPGVPASCRVVAVFDTAPDDGTLDDSTLHGSRVAAVVASVAPQTRLIGIDVFQSGFAFDADVIEGINWAIANQATWRIAAINMSLGDTSRNTTACSFGNPYRTPIAQARNAGIVTVISSGNSAYTSGTFNPGIASPACTPQAVSVGAVFDSAGFDVSFSNCSDQAAVDKPVCFSQVAPILSLLAPGAAIDVLGTSSYGTSFAAPFVAGAVAVLRSARPGETAAQTATRLTQFGTLVLDARVNTSFPRLQLNASLQLPANDAFASAVSLAGNAGSTTGTNVLATKEPGEPAHAGNAGGASVWWKWTAPGPGTLTLSTAGSSFDTLLAVYTGTDVASLAPIAANDNASGGAVTTSQLTFDAVAGTTYWFAVDGFGAASGSITLNWSLAAPVSADLGLSLALSPAIVVAGTDTTLTATVTNIGPSAAQAVTVTIAVPALLGITAVPASCASAAATVTCTQATLAAGASAGFVLVLRALAPGDASVAASVAAATSDPVKSNNAAAVALHADPAAPPDGNVPLPGWSLLLMGASLLGVLLGRPGRRRRA